MPGILFLSSLPSWRRTTSSRRGAFFLRVVRELGPLHRRRTRPPREQDRRGCAEAVRAVVATGGSIATHDPQRLVPACCRTLARSRHWTSSRSRISVARSALSASASRAHDKDPPLTSRYHVRLIPPGTSQVPGSIPVRAIVETRMAWANLPPGSPSIYFCLLISRVSLLVFLLASAAIDDKNCFKFK
jgi:hypothetical protein